MEFIPVEVLTNINAYLNKLKHYNQFVLHLTDWNKIIILLIPSYMLTPYILERINTDLSIFSHLFSDEDDDEDNQNIDLINLNNENIIRICSDVYVNSYDFKQDMILDRIWYFNY